MRLPPIHYLRWARSRDFDPTDFALTLSGMGSPDPQILGEVATQELLRFEDGDRSILGAEIAAALNCPPDAVWTQPGTHGALLSLLAARLADHPGPVIVEAPAYEPLRRIPEFLGAPVLRLPRPRSTDFAPDWAALERLGEQRPSALLLSHPHNPSGAVLGAEDRRRLHEWARLHDCALLSDEVYLEFLSDSDRHSFYGLGGQLAVTRSFTKVMGLGGLRITIVLGPPAWLARAAQFSDYGPLALSAPSQALGRVAFAQREKLWLRARERSACGRAIVSGWLAEWKDEVAAFLPPAGIICFPRLSSTLHAAALARAQVDVESGLFGYGLDAHPDGSHVWIAALAREERVHLTPGAFFEDPLAFRLGFGVEAAALREALNRLSRFLRRAKEMA